MQSVSNIISYPDLLIALIYFLAIILVANFVKSRNINKYPEYKYLTKALIAKLIGATIFCLVYVFYYNGGDTTNYFLGSKALVGVLFQDIEKGIALIFNTDSYFNSWKSFNAGSGYPPTYMWRDTQTFAVSRFSSLFYILGSGSFIVTSFFTAVFSFIGIWKLYRLFNMLYPGYSKGLFYIMLVLPTLIFWGSGIMKDSYVLGSTCWLTFNFYRIFIERKHLLWNIIFLQLNLLILLNTKAYVLISLFPGIILWINSAYLKTSKSFVSKTLKLPLFILIFGFGGYIVLSNISSLMGVYGDVDSALEQAQVIQQDLLREEAYGSNNYNIGKIDGSIGGVFSLAPVAVFTAIYRPLFWEIGSPIMVISVIENTILLFFSLYLFINVGPLRLARVLFSEPILLYAFVFSIIFAFGVGIASTNFGALVRYRVPLIPFYFPMLFLVFKISNKKKLSKV
ncbi:MAG: hypothetical protein CL846_04980 [Crocinitomicaceae bacterium]|nr:hypothetical protein [Crocinitomicaceae bacterium]|tara:strand:- start:2158 stop:3516 length:1359 start_codon:yes stop_codon:yes gene_type:complete